jgi:hypothetical protein
MKRAVATSLTVAKSIMAIATVTQTPGGVALMDDAERRVGRRMMLGLAAAALAGAAPSASMPEGATLLVAGPDGGLVDVWAQWLEPTLRRVIAPDTGLRLDVVGGADGVTAANQFEARIAPDGSTALLLPGSAAMAWLVGDPRARFDAARWVPALAGITPSLVASRISAGRILGGAPLRLAAASPTGPDLPAMLALDLLGANWQPVFGLSEAAAQVALAQGSVDAVCLHGRRVLDMSYALRAAGAPPIFTFGVVDEAGQPQRDPAFIDVPDASELMPAGAAADERLRAAWRATIAAGQLEVALVLPQLTPAAMVALWRRGCAQAVGSAPVQAQAISIGVRALSVPWATASTAAVTADGPSLLALRHWLATRLEYRPG